MQFITVNYFFYYPNFSALFEYFSLFFVHNLWRSCSTRESTMKIRNYCLVCIITATSLFSYFKIKYRHYCYHFKFVNFKHLISSFYCVRGKNKITKLLTNILFQAFFRIRTTPLTLFCNESICSL